jgi:hypothetical protein
MIVRRSGLCSNTRSISAVSSSESEEDIDILEKDDECEDHLCTNGKRPLGPGLLSALDPEYPSFTSTSSLKPTVRRHESIPQWGGWLPQCLWSFRRSEFGQRCFRRGFGGFRRGLSERMGLKHCLLLGFGTLILSLGGIIPLTYIIVEKLYPHIPLQLRVHVFPPTVASKNGKENNEMSGGKSCRYDRRRRWICRLCPDAYDLSNAPSSTRLLQKQHYVHLFVGSIGVRSHAVSVTMIPRTISSWTIENLVTQAGFSITCSLNAH